MILLRNSHQGVSKNILKIDSTGITPDDAQYARFSEALMLGDFARSQKVTVYYSFICKCLNLRSHVNVITNLNNSKPAVAFIFIHPTFVPDFLG